jgi:hypothetical protein
VKQSRSEREFEGNNAIKKSSLILCIKKYKNGEFTEFLFSSQGDKKF